MPIHGSPSIHKPTQPEPVYLAESSSRFATPTYSSATVACQDSEATVCTPTIPATHTDVKSDSDKPALKKAVSPMFSSHMLNLKSLPVREPTIFVNPPFSNQSVPATQFLASTREELEQDRCRIDTAIEEYSRRFSDQISEELRGSVHFQQLLEHLRSWVEQVERRHAGLSHTLSSIRRDLQARSGVDNQSKLEHDYNNTVLHAYAETIITLETTQILLQGALCHVWPCGI